MDCMYWGRKCLVDFSAGKTELMSFDHSSSGGFINVKMDGSFIDGKSSLKMLGLFFSFWTGTLLCIKIFFKRINFIYTKRHDNNRQCRPG